MPPSRNLIFVLAHGLRSDAMADARTWPLNTPHFEALARRGLRMAAISACPTDPGAAVCLMTGLHARQHGHVRDGDRPSLTNALPRWLREQGYHVAGVGDVGWIRDQFDRCVVVDDVTRPEPEDCDYIKTLEADGMATAVKQQRRQRQRSGPFEPDRLLLEPEQDADGFITSQAARLIETMPEEQPWAIVVWFTGPGNDLPPPTLYDGLVNPADLRDGFVPADFRTLDVLAEPVHPRSMLQRLEPDSIARVRADYLGRVSLIDYGLRRIVDASDRRGDRVRTWTVVTSDRGHLLGEHGLVGHRSFLDGAIEVPLIIAPPRDDPMPDDAIPEGLFSTLDATATVAALGGCDPPTGVTGRSLMPLVNNENVAPVRGGILSEFNDRLMLETERYKAVFNRCTGRCIGLYDLLTDTDEKRNLIDETTGQNALESLRHRLADALLPLRAVAVR